MAVPLAGWYPDPSGTARYRWWDGAAWTDAVTDDPDAAPSDVPASSEAPKPSEDSASPRDSAADDAATSGAQDQHGGPPPNRLVALVVAVTLVVSGGVVGVIGWRNFQSARSAAQARPHQSATSHQSTAPDRSPEQTSVSGQLDEVSRRASLDTARMVLPGEPYELVGNPVSVPPAFDAMFVANAPVHPDFNGSQTWSATVGIGHVPAGSWDAEDPAAFGRRALTGISRQFFGYTPTTVTTWKYRPATVGSAGCAKITANVRYAVKGLASTFDRLTIIGCPAGTDGSAVAAVSSVPNDASDTVTRLAAQSLSTFRSR